MDQYHYLFKFILIGDTNVGKSCILLRYTENHFRDEHDATIGVEFGSQLFKQNDKTIKIQIWDTAGQESFRSITRSYYKGSIGVLLVFDVTNKESFQNVLNWYNEVHEQTAENANFFLIGNKIDLDSERQVPTLEAKTFADKYKMQYIETSAKTSQNLEQAFELCALDVIAKIEKKLIDFSNEYSGIKLGPLCQQTAEQQVETQDQQQVKQEKKGCC